MTRAPTPQTHTSSPSFVFSIPEISTGVKAYVELIESGTELMPKWPLEKFGLREIAVIKVQHGPLIILAERKGAILAIPTSFIIEMIDTTIREVMIPPSMLALTLYQEVIAWGEAFVKPALRLIEFLEESMREAQELAPKYGMEWLWWIATEIAETAEILLMMALRCIGVMPVKPLEERLEMMEKVSSRKCSWRYYGVAERAERVLREARELARAAWRAARELEDKW